MPSRLRDASAVIAAPLTAAGAFIAVRFAVAEVSPYTVAAFRACTAAVAFLILFVVKPGWFGPRVRPADVPHFLLLGFSGAVLYTVALSTGQQTTSAGVAAVLVATFPIWVAVMAVAFTGEHLPGRGWIGLGVAFVGATVVSSTKPLETAAGGALRGALLLLLAALSQATYVVAVKPMVRRYGPIGAVAGTVWAAAALVLPVLWWIMPEHGAMSWRTPAAVAFLALITTVSGASVWAYLIGRLGSARAASLFYLVPPAAVAMEWLIFGNALSAELAVGGVLTLVGVTLVRPTGRVREARPARSCALPVGGEEVLCGCDGR